MGVTFRFFSPLGMAPVVALLGFGLFERGFPVVRTACSESAFGFSQFAQQEAKHAVYFVETREDSSFISLMLHIVSGWEMR